jgi:hypothetical protein
MTDSEKNIAKYAAQMLQAKRESSLSTEERELAKLLTKHGYLRQPTFGFLGTITNKAMIRAGEGTPVGKDPIFISLRNGHSRAGGLELI